MGLSPQEEDAFAAIVSYLARGRAIPWATVVVSVVVVGIADAVAVWLGVHHHLATLFYGTFIVALAAGLSLIALGGRRARSM